MTKDSLIKGTIILTIAAFVARFLGLIQRVPLQHLLGDSGNATYGTAYGVYFILLLIATAGVPSALSKLISERLALGNHREAQRIFRGAVLFAVWAGAIMTVLLFIFAPYYASLADNEDATIAIRALAPALLLFPLIAMMRGYFQGRQMMMANGISQIWEQILRVITAVALAYIIIKLGYSEKWAAAGASFGGVMGSVAAFAVMFLAYRALHQKDRAERLAERSGYGRTTAKELSYKQIYLLIFKLSIPITVISITVQFVYNIDNLMTIPLLRGDLGREGAKEVLGILLGRAQSLAGIPPILAIAISQSILPIVSSAYAKLDMAAVREQTARALRICIITCLPMIIILCTAARPINSFLFNNSELKAASVTEVDWIIVLLTAGTFFQILMMISGSILTGMGETRRPMIHVGMGMVVKVVMTVLLSRWFGIYGIIMATTLCFVSITFQNLKVLRGKVHFVIFGRRKWTGLALTSLILTAAGIGIEGLGNRYIHILGGLRYGITATFVGVILIVLYPVLLAMFRVMTAEDVKSLPRPLQKLIRKATGAARRTLAQR